VWGVRRFVTHVKRVGPLREGGPVVHEQLRHIVAPQHIEKDYLDTRCSYAISECSKDITLVKVVAPMGIYTNYLESNLTYPYKVK
jgi:hypothetical protein